MPEATPPATGDPAATTPAPGDPAAGQPATGDPEDTLGDAGKRALQAEREARAEAERLASEANRELKKLRDAQKTEAEREAEELATLRRQNAELLAERQAGRVRDAARAAATKAGFWDPDIAADLIEASGAVQIDDQGRPKNVDALIAELAKQKPRLVNGAGGAPDFGGGYRGGSAQTGSQQMNDAIRKAAGRA